MEPSNVKELMRERDDGVEENRQEVCATISQTYRDDDRRVPRSAQLQLAREWATLGGD